MLTEQILPERPLRVLALAKQIPVFQEMRLGADRRLIREGVLHMNDYCRRAVAKGLEIAKLSGGTISVMTLGPDSADTVCREALAFGADSGLSVRGIHVCDRAFAGSDTLATARALAAAIRHTGPYDLILCGLNSLDADTGQVPPQIAELLDLPFAAGVRRLGLEGETLSLELEHDDEKSTVEVALPALLSCAERLCDPCKVKDPEIWAQQDASLIEKLSAADITDESDADNSVAWGQEGSPTYVGETRLVPTDREQVIVWNGGNSRDLEAAIQRVAELCSERGALDAADVAEVIENQQRSLEISPERPPETSSLLTVGVIVEPDRLLVTRELQGAAAELASQIGGKVVAMGSHLPDAQELGSFGADEGIVFETTAGDLMEEDIAVAVSAWIEKESVWALLAPGTAWGRQVASRVAAKQKAGLVGDAIGLEMGSSFENFDDPLLRHRLIADKPAFGGQLVAEIFCSSPLQMATLRAGVLPLLAPRKAKPAVISVQPCMPRKRIQLLSRQRDDNSDELANADVVIGIGQGVDIDDYPLLQDLCHRLGATLCATRKVTDRGWLPRARQVGITGHSISPRLYIAIGLAGNFNHTVGVRTSGTVVAINCDSEAPIFQTCDIGMVGDWRELLPPLVEALLSRTA